MSQHDMDLANAAGATFRSDANAALQALASTSKGSSAPSTPYTGQMWIDDSASPWVLKCYDGANHIPVGTIDPTNNVFAPVFHGSPYYAALSGTDTYTGTLSPAPAAYIDGALYLGKIPNANTSTTPTVNYNSLGAKTVVKLGNTALVAGDMPANHMAIFQYNGSLGKLVLLNPAYANATVMRGHIAGLTLSNNGTDATNDIDIAVGEAVDSTNAYLMQLSSAMTKRLDAAWAAGTNQGMLDGTESVAGTPDVSTWYHIYLIRKDSDGTVDILASESATAPTMPTGYTYKRRIGSIYNNSAGDIDAFAQIGDDFYLSVPVNARNSAISTTSAELLTLRTPLGVKVESNISMYMRHSGTDYYALVTCPDQADTAPSSTLFTLVAMTGGTSDRYPTCARVHTNTSSQVRTRASSSNANHDFVVTTHGWRDSRGRFD